MTPVAEMHKNAILMTLNISTWSARKYDKKVTAETNATHGADADAGRYNKKLLPGDAPEYKALIQHVNEMRDFHYLNTQPWSDGGARILAIKNYATYVDHMRKGTAKFYSLLDDFERAYPRLRADAQLKLNGMWNEADYPEDIRSKFSFAFQPDPLPVSGDLRVDLPRAEMEVLAKRVEENYKQRLAEAQADAVRKLYKVVNNLVERLSSQEKCPNCNGDGATIETRKRPKKGETVPCWICNGSGVKGATFRDSLITNAREVTDVLKRINLTNDPQLEELREKTEKITATTEAETLRTDDSLRAKTATRAQSILDAMTATYGKQMFV